MFIILPSDPTTLNASEYLTQQGIEHSVLAIPDELGYKTGASQGIYLPQEGAKVMIDLCSAGFVIMRVFKEFEDPRCHS